MNLSHALICVGLALVTAGACVQAPVPATTPTLSTVTEQLISTRGPTSTFPPTLESTATATLTAIPSQTAPPTASPTATPTATPIGGALGGVIFSPQITGAVQDTVLVRQSDLADPSSALPILSKATIEKSLSGSVQYVNVDSISPAGQVMYLYVGQNGHTSGNPAIASVDLKFLAMIPFNRYLFGSAYQQLWSPTGSAIMGSRGAGTSIVVNANNKVRYWYVLGNPLGWAANGLDAYISDPSGAGILMYDIANGSQQDVELSFLRKIIKANPHDSDKWEYLIGASASPDGHATLLLTGQLSSPENMKLYLAGADFSNEATLRSFETTCNPFTYYIRQWSPDGRYVWLMNQLCDGLVINVQDRSTPIQKDFFYDEQGRWRRFPCGWSPDNHFVTYSSGRLSLWDPLHTEQPVREVAYAGQGCPAWLP